MRASFDSFGRVDRRERPAIDAGRAEEVLRRSAVTSSMLAYGNGRSYGDSCHNDAGFLIPMRPRRQIRSFDAETGILDVDAGVTLDEITQAVATSGFFLPVTPGTCLVTVGGAIANDVHGKNHHRRGTFGCHVEALELLRSDGIVYSCRTDENANLFRATIGGMGLTGLILGAKLKLMRVTSLDIEQRIVPFSHLEEYFELAQRFDLEHEYAVAWLDQLAPAGHGLLIAGNHAQNGNFTTQELRPRLRVPFDLPFSALNRTSLKLFNKAYFQSNIRKSENQRTAYRRFFYPLDGVGNWNLLYGPRGLYQHQSVVPFETARQVIPELLAVSRKEKHASFLTVLKRFGTVQSPGLLSFPRPGYTLTMDFPNRGKETVQLLDRLDRMTIEAGGRVNPYKDQRMAASVFKAGFPEWTQLEELRDPAFSSNFWQRTGACQ